MHSQKNNAPFEIGDFILQVAEAMPGDILGAMGKIYLTEDGQDLVKHFLTRARPN